VTRWLLILITTLGSAAGPAHGLGLFAKRVRRQVIPTHSAVIDDSVFTLHNGRLYRHDRQTRLLKAVSRWPHLSKIARFKDLLAGLTYQGELKFWRSSEDGLWQPVPSHLPTTGLLDFSANQNVLVSLHRDGRVEQWSSLNSRSHLVGLVKFIGVEGYAAEHGFGLIYPDQARLYLIPSKTNCGELLLDIPR
jgi:hypothetical protein